MSAPTTASAAIDRWLAHNRRYDALTIRHGDLAVTIHNAVIWEMTADTIDIAQHGHNLGVAILYRDRITAVSASMDGHRVSIRYT